MGCLEFWVVNSFLAGLAFFILFLVVDTQYPYYPYGVAGSKQKPDNGSSATACIIAAALYVLIGLGLLLWQKSRESRIEKSREYPVANKERSYSQPVLRGPQMEL